MIIITEIVIFPILKYLFQKINWNNLIVKMECSTVKYVTEFSYLCYLCYLLNNMVTYFYFIFYFLFLLFLVSVVIEINFEEDSNFQKLQLVMVQWYDYADVTAKKKR